MCKRINLIGEKYGCLTVIEPTENIGNRTAWLCKCDCGEVVATTTKSLRSGHRTSCGCKKYRGILELNYVDGTCLEMIKSNTVRTNNRSGEVGVFYDSRSSKWRAEIMFKGKRYYLGRFSTMAKAVEARRDARDRLHGEFIKAYVND